MRYFSIPDEAFDEPPAGKSGVCPRQTAGYAFLEKPACGPSAGFSIKNNSPTPAPLKKSKKQNFLKKA
jgi:hypothetical protein